VSERHELAENSVLVSLVLCLALAAAPGWGLFKAFYDLVALSQEDPMPLHYGIDLIALGVVGEASIIPAFAGEPVALGNDPPESTQHNMPPYTSIWCPMRTAGNLAADHHHKDAAAAGVLLLCAKDLFLCASARDIVHRRNQQHRAMLRIIIK
jgi:hypothetical protein